MKTKNIYFNPNPIKNETGDCVIRTFCKALDMDWDSVYKELCELGFELKSMPNSDDTWKEYAKRKGFTHHKVSNKKGSKRPTVDSFARANRKGTFILNVANHIVAVVNGHYYDTWDCGHKSLYGFYELPAEETTEVVEEPKPVEENGVSGNLAIMERNGNIIVVMGNTSQHRVEAHYYEVKMKDSMNALRRVSIQVGDYSYRRDEETGWYKKNGRGRVRVKEEKAILETIKWTDQFMRDQDYFFDWY